MTDDEIRNYRGILVSSTFRESRRVAGKTISENRSDFVPLCIYTADLKSRIRESKDKAQPTTERKS